MLESCNSMTHFSIFFFSLITSHPIYLLYFIFFFPYLFKLVTFLSPLLFTTLLVYITFLTLLERFCPGNTHANDHIDNLEIYGIFFGKVDDEHRVGVFEESNNLEENDDDQDSVHKLENNSSINSCQEKARLENFLQILNQFESMTRCNVEKKTKNEPKADKVVVAREKVVNSFSGIGEMRKETPWNATLACMLFEERQHDGGEGMDSLWEAYEEESWDEEEEIETGELCCLQAIKMSWSTKLNLGMKISKAIKGFVTR